MTTPTESAAILTNEWILATIEIVRDQGGFHTLAFPSDVATIAFARAIEADIHAALAAVPDHINDAVKLVEPVSAAPVVPTIDRKATDAEVADWADRHDISNRLGSNAREAFEDAESLHMTYAAPMMLVDRNAVLEEAAVMLQNFRPTPATEFGRLKTAQSRVSDIDCIAAVRALKSAAHANMPQNKDDAVKASWTKYAKGKNLSLSDYGTFCAGYGANIMPQPAVLAAAPAAPSVQDAPSDEQSQPQQSGSIRPSAEPAGQQESMHFDFHAHLARQAAWSKLTFGPGARTAGVCDHIRKELLEIEADPLDLKEWIDVVILALDGAWRCGGLPDQIISSIVAKQTKNEGRNWPDWRTADPDKAIEHDRTGEQTSSAPGRICSPTDAQVAAPVSGEVATDKCAYPNCACIGGGVFKPCVRAGEVVRPDLTTLPTIDSSRGKLVRLSDVQALFAPDQTTDPKEHDPYIVSFEASEYAYEKVIEELRPGVESFLQKPDQATGEKK